MTIAFLRHLNVSYPRSLGGVRPIHYMIPFRNDLMLNHDCDYWALVDKVLYLKHANAVLSRGATPKPIRSSRMLGRTYNSLAAQRALTTSL
jgi:hypothetical protein